MSTSSQPVIAVANLKFRYAEGEFELGIDELAIQPGEQVAAIGPSGSGKTTLLNMLAGIRIPSQGNILIDGANIALLSDRARRDFRVRHIGMVFQQFELIEYLNVLDNILLPYRINRSLRLTLDVRDRARELAEEVGVLDKLGRYVHQLSQGERQRVAICRSLISDPKIILADEPTGSLDPVNALRVLDTLIEQANKHQATLLVVTHDHSLLPRFNRVVDFSDFQLDSTNRGAIRAEVGDG